MNKNHVLITMLILPFSLIKPAFTQESVPPGISFVSPNDRYCVQLVVIDGMLRFMIKDAKTERVDDSIRSTGPLYLHWATNSESFVTVEHVAKGSYGRVVYLAGDRWLSVRVEPPFKGKMSYKVTIVELQPDRVHYKFAVTKLADNWEPIDHSFCDLDVILATGKVTNLKWTSASEAELIKTPGPDEPMCIPSMPPRASSNCPGGTR